MAGAAASTPARTVATNRTRFICTSLSCDRAAIVPDLSADDRQHRMQTLDRLVRDARGLEKVVAQDDDVSEFTRFNRPEPVLVARKPGAADRIQAERLDATERFVSLDQPVRVIPASDN